MGSGPSKDFRVDYLGRAARDWVGAGGAGWDRNLHIFSNIYRCVGFGVWCAFGWGLGSRGATLGTAVSIQIKRVQEPT